MINASKSKFLISLISLLGIAGLLIAGAALISFIPEECYLQRFDQAEFIAVDSSDPMQVIHVQSGQARQLPDTWDISRPDRGGFGWYRIRFSRPATSDLLGIFIPRINMNAALYLNGSIIGTTGHFEEPTSRNWNRPAYFQIPADTLHPGRNELLVAIKAYANDGGGISRIFIGEHDKLFPVFARWNALKIDLSLAVCALTLAAAAATLTLWLLRRQEDMYGWFSLTSLACAFFLCNHFIREIPVPYRVWEWAVHGSIGAFVVFLYLFSRRYAGKPRRRHERGLIIYLAVSLALLALLPESNLSIAFSIWHLGTLTIAGMSLVLIWRLWQQNRSYENFIVFQGILLNLALGFHDWLIMAFSLQGILFSLMQLAPPTMLAAIAWVLVVQFAKARNTADNFNLTLSQRIQETEEALARKHAKLQELLQTQAKAEERERIMQDLHDGLGNYLLSAHSMAATSGGGQQLQETLNDAVIWLRASIDALDEAGHDLTSLLATFRSRIEPRLIACGLKLRWRMDELGDLDINPEYRMHLLRMLQECITNVIKHADAEQISIGIERKEWDLIVRVEDDGSGFSKASEGRGINHLRQRAVSLHGQIDIDSGNLGTTIAIRFPAHHRASAAT